MCTPEFARLLTNVGALSGRVIRLLQKKLFEAMGLNRMLKGKYGSWQRIVDWMSIGKIMFLTFYKHVWFGLQGAASTSERKLHTSFRQEHKLHH